MFGLPKPAWRRAILVLLGVAALLCWRPASVSAASLRLMIDGRPVESDPAPVLRDGRTLVPVRVLMESLGAEVNWIEAQGGVSVIRSDRSVFMRIDSHLVEVSHGGKDILLSDVAPRLIDNRTFVPIRLVANALGVSVRWDQASATVFVDSSQSASPAPFSTVKLLGIESGQSLAEQVKLQISLGSGGTPPGAKEVRFLLLDPATGKGNIIARGSALTGEYTWTPDVVSNGDRILAAAIYDGQGKFLAGDAATVLVDIEPSVRVTGLTEGQTVTGNLTLSPQLNFSAAYVVYEIECPASGRKIISPKSDPIGSYTFVPALADNGPLKVRLLAYTVTGQSFPSPTVEANLAVSRQLSLRGVSANANVERPLNLSVSANFPISGIEYILRDPSTGTFETLGWTETAGIRFLQRPDQQGKRELLARVTDTTGQIFSTAAVPVNITGRSLLLLSGVGPNQVLTGVANLAVESNVPLETVRYILTNRSTGVESEIGSLVPGAILDWAPQTAGEWSLRAEGLRAGGSVLKSETVSFRVYLGTIYGPRPVVARDQFIGLASDLAVKSWHETGMSAALQTAQAILETGWGQSVPVDKYTGLFSKNLFGIKGTGPAGSVVSNTWEEYNGVAFRIDANFRAYHSIEQSWADHKNLLLVAARYAPFRDVMHDSTLGAWALRRAGYATDSQYPIKLIDIIMRFELWRLDLTGI